MLNILTGIDANKLDDEAIAMLFAIDSINELIKLGELDGPMLKVKGMETTIKEIVEIGREPSREKVEWAAKSLIANVNGYGNIDRFLDGKVNKD